ncbi:MAG: terminase family protein [Parvibaculum sp.]|uniref:DNA-packaging protein n=1 Tax=Parvibaculum sp. TaxID=2024848 RepID=UPI0028434823|nr:terminase family protein [Parvibaculum sp.]MDR3497755.1 terminase family protein [Parvibaculum sp.]
MRAEFLASLAPRETAWLLEHWPFWARADQLAPEGEWTTWLVLGGRGAGKTRAGAEWVRGEVEAGRAGRIALVGETFADVREVMIDGPSGLGALGRNRPRYEASRKRLLWPNGAVAHAFSASEPEGLRGPQFDAAWADEVAKWRHAEDAWDMLQFGLRLGARPRQVVTTTPRPAPILKRLLADEASMVTKASTYANRANLAAAFFRSVITRYEGTRLGRQELDAELIEDNPDALWSRGVIDAGRLRAAPALARIVVAVDPPATSGANADECGIVVAGVDAEGRGFVLDDRSMGGLTPLAWANRAAKAFRDHEADRIVAEVNQGGEMVAAIMRQVMPAAPLKLVRATRGKQARAEPVAALYERGLVSHLGSLAKLEDQMCDFVPGMTRSPDRVDALVWALTDLMLDGESGSPKVRRL